jgi:hypothetical protein
MPPVFSYEQRRQLLIFLVGTFGMTRTSLVRNLSDGFSVNPNTSDALARQAIQ